MTAREIIAASGALRSVCSDGNSDVDRVADAILSALSAAGYRIVGPGELDGPTLERAVQEASKFLRADHVRLMAGEMTAQEMRTAKAIAIGIAAAIRALQPAQPLSSNGDGT